MVEKRRKLQLGNREVDVTDVDIIERKHESVAEYRLEDGSVVRVATPITSVLRIEESYDWEGKPVYLAIPGTSVTVIHVSEELRQKK